MKALKMYIFHFHYFYCFKIWYFLNQKKHLNDLKMLNKLITILKILEMWLRDVFNMDIFTKIYTNLV